MKNYRRHDNTGELSSSRAINYGPTKMYAESDEFSGMNVVLVKVTSYVL